MENGAIIVYFSHNLPGNIGRTILAKLVASLTSDIAEPDFKNKHLGYREEEIPLTSRKRYHGDYKLFHVSMNIHLL